MTHLFAHSHCRCCCTDCIDDVDDEESGNGMEMINLNETLNKTI